jgi:hypothetical protein
MKLLLLIPFLLGNSAGGGSAILEGLIALLVVLGIFVGLVWGAIKLWEMASRSKD